MSAARDLFGHPVPALTRRAEVSICGHYRYLLEQRWRSGAPLLWVMLNPSIADAERDDPTIRRCRKWASRWGYGGMLVVNIYPYRSPDPGRLAAWLASESTVELGRVRARNLETIREASAEAGKVVCAWGDGAPELDWVAAAQDALAEGGRRHAMRGTLRWRRLYCLRLTASGNPTHPLARGKSTVPASAEPRAWHDVVERVAP